MYSEAALACSAAAFMVKPVMLMLNFASNCGIRPLLTAGLDYLSMRVCFAISCSTVILAPKPRPSNADFFMTDSTVRS